MLDASALRQNLPPAAFAGHFGGHSPSMAQVSLPATSCCRVAEDEQNIKKI